MKPAKEKAQELVDKFMKLYNYTSMASPICDSTAEQCAVIAVEEIQNIKAIYVNDIEYDYWEQVKHELNKSE